MNTMWTLIIIFIFFAVMGLIGYIIGKIRGKKTEARLMNMFNEEKKVMYHIMINELLISQKKYSEALPLIDHTLEITDKNLFKLKYYLILWSKSNAMFKLGEMNENHQKGYQQMKDAMMIFKEVEQNIPHEDSDKIIQNVNKARQMFETDMKEFEMKYQSELS